MNDVAEHVHEWHLAESGIIIDTNPPQEPFVCACGAFTHDPETGAPCSICAPSDYQQRSDDLITLSGGDFDGQVIVRPVNRSVNLRSTRRGDDSRFLHYEQTDDPNVWRFAWNDWIKSFEPRVAVPPPSEGTPQP